MAESIVKGRRRYKRAKASSSPQGAPLEAAEVRTGIEGDTTEPEAQASDDQEQALSRETFQVEEPIRKSLAGDGHAARWRSGKKAKEQAAQSALTLLTILDGAIGLSLGPECQLTNDERAMIQEPMARMMARMTPETSEMIDKYTDPVLLAFGFIMWGSRVFFVLQRQANEAKPKPAKSPVEYNPATPAPAFQSMPSDMATGIPQDVAEVMG